MKRRSSDFEFQAVEAGAWLGQQLLNSSSSTSLLTSVNPSTEESLAQVRTADSSIYDKLIHALHNEAQTWRNVPAPKRGELVYQLGQKIRQHQRALAELITLEMGKPAREAEGEVQDRAVCVSEDVCAGAAGAEGADVGAEPAELVAWR